MSDNRRSEAHTLHLEPIGIVRNNMRLKFDAPHQPTAGSEHPSVIELFTRENLDHALRDLDGFERIWLIWWFHQTKGWKPMVRPPRGPAVKRGVFATRSPHRPNPLGLTVVPLLQIQGHSLIIGNCDLIDGTPILDIKPYLPAVDAFPHSKAGWVQKLEEQQALAPAFHVCASPLALNQLEWLKSHWGIDVWTRAQELLARDPSPHKTRRIHAVGNLWRMGCGAWRLYFERTERTVQVLHIGPGYTKTALHKAEYRHVPNRDAQIKFLEHWGDSFSAEAQSAGAGSE